ncbi:hypothetical protein G6F56_007316 [Rhizopus delemar]|uniref:tRNA/rRNA methyltransferase SpoU type domain-containing protein n=1 Tax=Rhizopus stolonifer TaxID=4846 RepID=A0A367KQS2_RHIST|nr:hypothetical protein G6F56_007316 [Rhizopus delemar]RCI04554.1 hypothetical protein CU098_012932 [Rhizopus stolonifer]
MSGYKYIFPDVFKRLHNAVNSKPKQLVKLRESKKYRYEKQTVVVQGFQYIKELRDLGFNFKSIFATAKKIPREDQEVGYPAKQVIEHTDAFPAKDYYLTDIDLTRNILGTASRPGIHEVYAEIEFPYYQPEGERWVVFDRVNDPESLGILVRTAKGLGWDSGIVTSDHSDLYNDTTIRASKIASLTWPHIMVGVDRLSDFLKKHNITPVVANVLPKDTQEEAWSPEFGHVNIKDIKSGSGVWFWNLNGKEPKVPKKMALILSCMHGGLHTSFDNDIRVSIPLEPGVNSLNVAAAGSIIMTELNRQRACVTK